MLTSKNPTLGTLTRSRTALALFAVTLLVGGSVTEASAKSRHHHRHHLSSQSNGSWRDSNAAITPSSGGHSFSGMASLSGNETGRKPASGQHFNRTAMTAAHRSLPFGTKLKVTHRDRSVVVTINDRVPVMPG